MDSSKDNTPCTVNSTVSTTTTTPPPPPPKNAARMLALALAESAQQVSGQSQSQASTAQSPLDASGLHHTTHPLVQASTPERGSGRTSPPPAFPPAKSQLAPPSPPANQQPVDFISLESAKTSTAPPVAQPETDSAPHSDALLRKSAPVPNATSQASPTRKSPERQPPTAVHVPAHNFSSCETLATSCRDTQVSTQSVPEVSHAFNTEWLL